MLRVEFCASLLLCELPYGCMDFSCRRYFNVQENKSTESFSIPETVSRFTSSAQKLVAEGSIQQAVVTLEEGLKVCPSSEEMWLMYLQLKSEVTSDSDVQSLYGFFSNAVAVSQSYTVVLEVRS